MTLIEAKNKKIPIAKSFSGGRFGSQLSTQGTNTPELFISFFFLDGLVKTLCSTDRGNPVERR